MVARGAGDISTMAVSRPIRRLKSVDLPTLGRPTRATTGLRACIDHLDRERLVTPGGGSAGNSRNTCHCAGDVRE